MIAGLSGNGDNVFPERWMDKNLVDPANDLDKLLYAAHRFYCFQRIVVH